MLDLNEKPENYTPLHKTLSLSLAQFVREEDEKRSNAKAFTPTFYLGPDCNPVDMLQGLIQKLNETHGGSIEQSHMYIDPISALNWMNVERQSEYQDGQSDIQFGAIAEMISHIYTEFHPAEELDILAIGPGGGEKEVHLTQLLASNFKKVRLFLIDISQPLLTNSYNYATSTLKEFSDKVFVYAIMANMHHLQRYLHTLSPSARGRRRLVLMMGGTFSNLTNEILFVRNSLQGLDEHDLVYVDVGIATASPDDPEKIRSLEPRLTHHIPLGWGGAVEKFLAEPILRYARGVKDIQFLDVLDTATCCVPGSYTIERRARVSFMHEKDKEFTIFLWKRYDPNKLIMRMKDEGLLPGAGWKFGKSPQRLGYLFKKGDRFDDNKSK